MRNLREIRMLLMLLSISSPILTLAQLRLQPNLGVNFLRNTINEEIPRLKSFQNIPSYYGGLSLNYKKYKYQFELGINVASIGAGVKYFPERDALYSEKTATPMLQYSLLYFYRLKEFHFFPKLYSHKTGLLYTATHPKKKFYFLNFDLYPFAGVCLNRIYLNRWYRNPNIDDYQTFGYSESGFIFRLYTKDVIQKKYAPSIKMGCKLQFKNNKVDMFALSFVYNLGLVDQLKTRWEYKDPSSNSFDLVAHVVSKGSYFGIHLSYPINITKPNPFHYEKLAETKSRNR